MRDALGSGSRAGGQMQLTILSAEVLKSKLGAKPDISISCNIFRHFFGVHRSEMAAVQVQPRRPPRGALVSPLFVAHRSEMAAGQSHTAQFPV